MESLDRRESPQRVLIISMRRSGGTLLRRLFDDHSQCSVVPFEFWGTRRKAHFDRAGNAIFQFLPPFLKVRYCARIRTYRKKFETVHGPEKWAEYLRDLGEIARLANAPSAFNDLSVRHYFENYSPQGLREKIVSHAGGLCTLTPRVLESVFGRASYLISYRDPRATFASMVQKQIKEGKPGYSKTPVQHFCDQWRHCIETYVLAPGQAVSTRFEDLVVDPESVMRRIAGELGIEYQESLTNPTRMGREKRANSSFGRSAGVDPSAATSWQEHLPREPRKMIESRLADLLEVLGYSSE